MKRRYGFLGAASLGVVAGLLLLVGLVVTTPGPKPVNYPTPTYVVLPTPTPTPLPIVTPEPTGPTGDNPDTTIPPFGDG